MKKMKEVWFWIVVILMDLVRLPIILATFIVTNISFWSSVLFARIVERIGDPDVIDGLNIGFNINIRHLDNLSSAYEEMKIEL